MRAFATINVLAWLAAQSQYAHAQEADCAQGCTAYVPPAYYVSWSPVPTAEPSYVVVPEGQASITITETVTLVKNLTANTATLVSSIRCGAATDANGRPVATATTGVELYPGITTNVAFPTQFTWVPEAQYAWSGVLPTDANNASVCASQTGGPTTIAFPTPEIPGTESFPVFPPDQADFVGSCYVAVLATAPVGQAWYASEYPNQSALQAPCGLSITSPPKLAARQATTTRFGAPFPMANNSTPVSTSASPTPEPTTTVVETTTSIESSTASPTPTIGSPTFSTTTTTLSESISTSSSITVLNPTQITTALPFSTASSASVVSLTTVVSTAQTITHVFGAPTTSTVPLPQSEIDTSLTAAVSSSTSESSSASTSEPTSESSSASSSTSSPPSSSTSSILSPVSSTASSTASTTASTPATSSASSSSSAVSASSSSTLALSGTSTETTSAQSTRLSSTTITTSAIIVAPASPTPSSSFAAAPSPSTSASLTVVPGLLSDTLGASSPITTITSTREATVTSTSATTVLTTQSATGVLSNGTAANGTATTSVTPFTGSGRKIASALGSVLAPIGMLWLVL